MSAAARVRSIRILVAGAGVCVTAQALIALGGRAFPLEAVRPARWLAR